MSQSHGQIDPTPRQLQILVLASRGMDRNEIAAELYISPWTVRNKLNDLRERVGAKNIAHALTICIARGLICVDGREERAFMPAPLDAVAA